MPTAFTSNPNHPRHRQPGHVERPERVERLLEVAQNDDVWGDLLQVEAYAADLDVALLAHTAEHVEHVQRVAAAGRSLDLDTYTTTDSVDVARHALGGLLRVTEAVLTGEAGNGFAAGRPPGHHATPSRAMGFCLFGNAAIAARWAQQQHDLERVLIVDFDVHHGNGTQDIFYDDPSVLFMSTHQSPLYPGTGRAQETGRGPGEGATRNVPLPARTGDAGYLAAFQRVLRPAALAFRPELILLSAGYDAHWRDPISRMHLSVCGFAGLVREVLDWAETCCDGRLVVTLEGGYDADALAYSALGTLRLLRDPAADIEDPLGPAPDHDADVARHLDDLARFHGV